MTAGMTPIEAAQHGAPPDVVTLAEGDWRVDVCAALGGALTRVTWRGRPVLRDCGDEPVATRNVRRAACYPLVPYSNRIGEARFVCDGDAHALRPNFPGEPHAMHGFGWQRAWRIAALDRARAVLRIDHERDADWPYACAIEQRIDVAHDVLRLELVLTNVDERPAPAGVGWHPYFPLSAHTQLRTTWEHVLTSGPDRLPAAVAPVPHAWRFDDFRPLAGVEVDHCFTGWRGDATIAEADYRLTLVATGTPAAVLFQPPGGAFFAFEPVSHSNNALQFREAAGTVPMRTLAPGESLHAAMMLSAHASEPE
jgi:aldose 1-epimerase